MWLTDEQKTASCSSIVTGNMTYTNACITQRHISTMILYMCLSPKHVLEKVCCYLYLLQGISRYDVW